MSKLIDLSLLQRAAIAAAEPDRAVTFPPPPAGADAGESVTHAMLYDLVGDRAIDLGEGDLGAFSPDGDFLAWMSPAGLRILHLPTMQHSTFSAVGLLNGFRDAATVVVSGPGGRVEIDITTGETSAVSESPHRLVPIERVGDTRLYAGGARPHGGTLEYTIVTSQLRTTVQALAVTLLTSTRSVVAVPAIDDSSIANLFLLDFEEGTVDPLFGVPLAGSAERGAGVLPLSGNATTISWTAEYCSDRARLHVFDLDTGTLTATNLDGWGEVVTAARIGVGHGFGAEAIVDLRAASWEYVLPERVPSDAAWSADYRFAMTGFVGGHGTGCPGT